MARRIIGLTRDNVSLLPSRCAECLFWEMTPVQRDRACGEERRHKAEWISRVLGEWGGCGVVATVDDSYRGHLVWAPPSYVPGAQGFATAPVSEDAVLLITGYVDPGARDGGLGRALVQTMARELHKRGDIRAVEAFADVKGSDGDCVLPVDFLTALGFSTHREHARYPRMRLDLRTAIAWRDVEAAFGRLLPTRLRPVTPASPVGRAPRGAR